MIKHTILRLFSSKYRKASSEAEKAKKLMKALIGAGSLSIVSR